MKQAITIVGCGIVGASIAYHLSKLDLTVTVLDRLPAPVAPDETVCATSTGAALGVLMGAISKKEKGGNLRRRLDSIQTYNQLIPELETLTGQSIPFNRQGILMLQFAADLDPENLTRWQRLIEVRRSQGWRLEILSGDRLKADVPYLNFETVKAAVYSPDDRQVNPVALTHALIAAAKQNGVTFHFDTTVTSATDGAIHTTIHTSTGELCTDWLVIAAGLGSTPLTMAMAQSIEIRPVLGQAVHLRLAKPLGQALQPVITGDDVHLVPLGGGDYWVGATVEFLEGELSGSMAPLPDRTQFEALMQQAIGFCPGLAQAEIIRTWSGLRPRPHGRPAPIVEPLPGYRRVLLATAHYRNGVLLAPATAKTVQAAIADETIVGV
jgi:glycine oxidase